MEKGKLYLCATPIGNLDDITIRVLNTLKSVDLIAAEDTRHSIKLLNHFEIKKPMTSYHEYNKVEKAIELVDKMLDGANIALITDAGTPGISDPGEELVRRSLEAGVSVTSLPGACAGIVALTSSGQKTRRFCFEGFLPTDKKELEQVLENLKEETRTIILHEAPHHLLRTLKLLYENLGNRSISICRELTKKFEEIEKTDIESAIQKYGEKEPKGEFVLVIEAKSFEEKIKEEQESWKETEISKHIEYYLNQGIDKKEAFKLVAKDRGISKRDVYSYYEENMK
ncbi:MAG: 16S rRNA (cytidine(1402)-2'-O)-methyltransferase [Lachnospiraceae bacterium]|nr:16S rRNA (cytidine(1402)-2'-O)-methyltransferase [Lachnospiraceae bacterium]